MQTIETIRSHFRFPGKPGRLMAALTAFVLLAAAAPNAGFAQEQDSQQQTEDQEEGLPIQDVTDPAQEEAVDEPFAEEGDIKKEEDMAIIDREPFDRLHFDAANDNWKLDIDPIEMPGGDFHGKIVPKENDGRLIFTMEKNYPGRIWATPWSSLVRVQRYSEMILDEAEKAMSDGDYGTAFRTLIYLAELEGYGSTAKIAQMMDRCLYEDGEENLRIGKFGEALAAYEELYRRSPQYRVRGAANVLEKITTCIDQFIEDKVAKGDFGSARILLESLHLDYGNKVADVLERWRADMRRRAIDRLRDVRTSVDNNDGMAAHEGARAVMYVMPDMLQSTNAFNAVIKQFPYVFVGVTQSAADMDVRRVENWSSRRVGYLVNRWLMEFEKPSDEGGQYRFPNGRFQPVDELGLKYRFQLNQSIDEPGIPSIQSYEIVDRLLEMATIGSDEYYVPWARLLHSIEIENERSVIFTLRYPHVRPQALLTMPYYAPGDYRSGDFFGLYKPLPEDDEGQVIFEFNDRYEKNNDIQYPRIVERVFRDSSQATDALLRGELDVVDRIYPGDINRLRSHPMISVKPYLVPTVHMLIPNPRNEHMDSDHFRRALHFGVDRSLIVREAISGGRVFDGFQVVSGPFPAETETADQLSYAYNTNVSPREYSAKLSLVLANQYIQQEQNRLEDEGVANPVVEMPRLVLAYPATETIAAACNLIAQQWRSVGIETELRRLPPGVTVPEDDDYDLLYAEVQMQEPLVDAYRLFGRGGLAKLIDPTIEQALRNLDKAYDWQGVSRALRRVHQQTANNLTILPLWQIVDHYAYRKNVFNVGNDIVFLYQNLNDWRIDGLQPPVANPEK